ncbi:MAG: hypothetical protein ACK41P_10840 [Asticcacaulis sp.]
MRTNGLKSDKRRSQSALGLMILSALALSGCAALPQPFDAPIDKTSPAAASAAAAAKSAKVYPRWAEFPEAPKDVPSLAEIKGRVESVEKVQATLQLETDALVWELTDPDAYAKVHLARFDKNLMDRIEKEPVDIEAWAKKNRDKVQPPAPIQ